MNAGDWIDLAFLILLVPVMGAFVYRVWSGRHSHKSITVRRGFGQITVEGYDVDTALALVRTFEEKVGQR